MKPFTLLIKPAGADCNLRCEYCFYIDHIEMFGSKKTRMDDETLDALIKSYMQTPQPMYSFAWQGGEPTLMGVEFYKKVVELQKKYAPPNAQVTNALQTNATLIDDEFAAFLAEYKFLVGVSIDGDAETHNYYRKNAAKKGSHAEVLRGVEFLKKHKVEYNILVLVNANNVKKPKEVYEYLKSIDVRFHQYIPCVEFDENNNLLPFAITGKQWGEFLTEIFNLWSKDDKQKISIRYFDSLLSLMLDGQITSCHLAGNCMQYFVCEHNGDIYPCDFFVQPHLKLGNIKTDSWETISASKIYSDFGKQKNEWNSKCDKCKYLMFCSGDCVKHRVYNDKKSDNLSHLCEGYYYFFENCLDRMKDIAREIIAMRKQNGFYAANQNIQLIDEISMDRNQPCFCYSGKKYKKCHGKYR